MNTCLTNMAFSISGEPVFLDEEAFLQLSFADPEDAGRVVRCDWYIDHLLLDAYTGRTLSGKLTCGKHRVGARILTEEGWSGVMSRDITVCAIPKSLSFDGPDRVNEGGEYDYQIIGSFEGGITSDITRYYRLFGQTVSFTGNRMKVPVNNITGDERGVMIFASRPGAANLSKNVRIIDQTPSAITELLLTGPATISEGKDYTYRITAVYSNGTRSDISAQTTFAFSESTRGYFTANTLFVRNNDSGDDNTAAVITASFGGQTRQIQVMIRNTTPVVLTSLLVSGATSVQEGNRYPYSLTGVYSDGTRSDLSLQATFSFNLAERGAFSGKMLQVYSNKVNTDSRTALVSATYNGQRADLAVQVIDSSPVELKELRLQRADGINSTVLNEGSSYSFQLLAVFSDGSAIDKTGQSTFKFNLPNRGSFSGSKLLLKSNETVNDTAQAIITATFKGLTERLNVQISDQSIKDFDWMVVKFKWDESAGSDLNAWVGYRSTGTSLDEEYVGKQSSPRVSIPANLPDTISPDAYLYWTGRNQASNTEKVIIGIHKFIKDYKPQPDILQIALSASWGGSVGNGKLIVELTTYRGGYVNFNGDFINFGLGGAEVLSQTMEVNINELNTYSLEGGIQAIGNVIYDQITKQYFLQPFLP